MVLGFIKHIFGYSFKSDPTVSFPEPCMELTTSKVLVESFKSGFPIRRLVERIGDPAWESFSKEVSHRGLQVFLKMLLFHNFTHADLHPGNILVRFVKTWPKPSSSYWSFNNPFVDVGEQWRATRSPSSFDDYDETQGFTPDRAVFDSLPPMVGSLDPTVLQNHWYYQPEVIILDTGLVNQLAGAQFRNFLDLFDALALKQDGALVGKLMVERAPLPESGKLSYEYMPVRLEVFYRRMKKVVDSLDSPFTSSSSTSKGDDDNVMKHKVGFSLKSNYLSNVLTEVFQIVREHHVRMDYRFTNLIVSMIILEGMGRQLSPDTDMFEEAKPLLMTALQRWIALWMTDVEDV